MSDDLTGGGVRQRNEGQRTAVARGSATRRLAARMGGSVILVVGAFLAFAAVAGATALQPHSFGSSFDGSDAVGGSPLSGGSKIAIDQQSETVYVGGGSGVYKFNANGVSQPFEALAPDTVISTGADFALDVDNSGTATQGRIYPFPTGVSQTEYFPYLPSGARYTGGQWPLLLSATSGVCGVGVTTSGDIWLGNGRFLTQYDADGSFTGKSINRFDLSKLACEVDVDTEDNLVITAEEQGFGGRVEKLDEEGNVLMHIDPGPSNGVAVDRSNNDIYVDRRGSIYHYDSEGDLLEKFGEAEGTFPGIEGSNGIAVDAHTHAVYVTNHRAGAEGIDIFPAGSAVTVPTAKFAKPDVGPTTATLRGTIDPEGLPTTGCVFEWGTSEEFLGHAESCEQGSVLTGSGAQAVSKEITGLNKGSAYFWALRGENVNGSTRTRIHEFHASEPPIIVAESLTKVNTDAAEFNGTFDPNGGPTKYWFEYGPEDGVYDHSVPAGAGTIPGPFEVESRSEFAFGLTPKTEYHYRTVVENDAAVVYGPDHHFKTFAIPPGDDFCSNALVRKQTGAALLPDCRAFELVSAANQGGYDVDSEMIAGDSPFEAAPAASDRFLYSMHYGALPGVAGEPTTFGHDPYVAHRTATGWATGYVGLPAAGLPSDGPYGSPVAGYDAGLSDFAFGGEHICEPCFADGSTNMPLRLADGSLVKGIEGSQGPIAAEPAGEVRQRFSADGSHFVFGSEQALEPTANDENGSVTFYSRRLPDGPTEVVSSTPGGGTMSGSEIAELGVSADGSRVLIGELVRTDSAGNEYFDLFMHIAGAADSVELASTPNGVLYDGMSADGTQVYFSTADPLAGDTDSSVDLFRAAVGSGSAQVSRVSTGIEGTGDRDTCTPSGTPEWNAGEESGQCSIVAFAGGAGVAAQSGAVFFLSPEKLDGSSNGIADEPNLYVAEVGRPPRFVATIDAGNVAIDHALHQSAVHSYGDFQVTPDGRFAAFNSALPIGGAETHGHTAIYRFAAEGGAVNCVSCGPSVNPDSTLAPNGLNLANDGRVFFTTAEQLALRDTNEVADVYEWEDGEVGLISSGTAVEGSTLATASADGRDAFFFTRDSLAPQDTNGSPVKVYDARAFGGFLYNAPPFPCKASDECHGPGTRAAEPPVINTREGNGRAPHQPARCKRGFVRKHGKCVHRHHRRHRHHKRHHHHKRHRHPAQDHHKRSHSGAARLHG
jgi:sugar lactone lactonase YvrE